VSDHRDDLDREITEVLRAETAGVEPAPDVWDRLAERAIAPAPRRRWPLLAAAAAVVLMVAAVGLVAFGPDDDKTGIADKDRRPTSSDGSTVDTTTSSTTSTTAGTSTTASTTTSTTTAPSRPQLVLQGDGFQGRKFGDPAEEVIAALTRLFGSPTEDRSDAARGQSPFGWCPGTTARTVSWGSVSALFTDERGPSRFSGWFVDGGEARTPAGIRVGSTVSDVRAAYPQATLETEPLGNRFLLDTGDRFVVGGLSGVADTDRVEYLTNHPCGE
jgi:hypothetical protein